jgi:hypothetical protein
MTKTVTRRIDKLEDRLGLAAGKPKLLLIASAAGRRQALDVDTCVDILRECGFLPTGPGIGLVNLLHLPEDLTAQELERFLREHGPEICGHTRPKATFK